MPLVEPEPRASSSRRRYTALAAVPAFNAASTIEAALRSIVESIRAYRGRGPVAISVVDDASADSTPALVAAFARSCDCDVYLAINPTNRGRACARNQALAAAAADNFLFLDHDDEYLLEHVETCLEALLRDPRADYVKTEVVLSEPVHSDWESRIAASLTQNLCVRAWCHRLIGGFHEEPEVETYGCDDQLYNRTLRECFRGVDVSRRTVKFFRRHGNSFDRQYERKFRHPAALAEITLSPLQRQLQPRILEIREQRVREVRARITRTARAGRGRAVVEEAPSLDSRARLTIAPFDDEGDRIYAIMVTGKSQARAKLAQASVLSFLMQNYGNRALVVVNDGDVDLDLAAVPANRVTYLRPSSRLALGGLRNLGLETVPNGALWTYWDDDDWHHPQLLTAQRSVLARLGVHACFLRNQIKYSFADDAAFVDSHPGGFAGTLLSVKHPGLRFPDAASGEDSAYTAALKSDSDWRWYPWNNPPQYFVRFFHGANTWDAKHFGFARPASGEWRLGAHAADYLTLVLSIYRSGGRE